MRSVFVSSIVICLLGSLCAAAPDEVKREPGIIELDFQVLKETLVPTKE